jgi:hypothetical protein
MMKKFLTLIFPAAIILAAATADARDVRGRVESVDKEAATFTLNNGITFPINENVNADELVPGTSVKVRYSNNRGRFEVRKVIIRGQ